MERSRLIGLWLSISVTVFMGGESEIKMHLPAAPPSGEETTVSGLDDIALFRLITCRLTESAKPSFTVNLLPCYASKAQTLFCAMLEQGIAASRVRAQLVMS